MNIAFGTLVIIVLLSPGFVCRYAFLKGPYSRKNFKPSISDDIFWSVIPAVFIQLTAFILLKSFGFQPSLRDIYLIIVGAEAIDFDVIDAGIAPFLIYSIIILAFSYLLGGLARWTVIRFSLDLKYNILKVNNEWYYLFSGKLTDEEVDFIQLDILVNSDKGTMLYSGILDDYFLNKEGGIDRLYLIKVHRDRRYEMPGDHFIIFGREILNINLTYFRLEEPSHSDT